MRVTADSTKFDSHANAFVMFKYGNLFAIAANPFRNLKFAITFVHNTKVKHKLRICQEYKSEALHQQNLFFKVSMSVYRPLYRST